MGHAFICSYTNEYIQHTPTLFHLPLSQDACWFSSVPTCFLLPKPPDHLYINLSAMHLFMFRTCIRFEVNLSFTWYLFCAGKRQIKQSPAVSCPQFITESRRVLAQLGEDDRASWHRERHRCPATQLKREVHRRWGAVIREQESDKK